VCIGCSEIAVGQVAAAAAVRWILFYLAGDPAAVFATGLGAHVLFFFIVNSHIVDTKLQRILYFIECRSLSK